MKHETSPRLRSTVRPAETEASAPDDPLSLEGLTLALGLAPVEAGRDPLLGQRVGSVLIERLIADGGMGRVYAGKQDKPGRTVAVKVVRPGVASSSLLKRFEYEAEVLGRLHHPGIAQIFSVGMHGVGDVAVPYFVMEYIPDARPLTRYAEDSKLPTRRRLELFGSVCDAVAHGHQKGVIHRDLKPGNILVDGQGRPKVIDFGVARATDSDIALTTMQTAVGQLIGTVQYMSPEQFDADAYELDVRSDVYALGVILYELLTGRPPYEVRHRPIAEIARVVKEDEPAPMSSWNSTLRGDLTLIAAKCLEKDRRRRYGSAGELAADIRNYLAGDPITAQPPSLMDAVSRLARKHRAAAIATACATVAMVAAALGIGMFAVRADRQRRHAVEERERADAAQQRAMAEQAAAEASRDAARGKLYLANMRSIQAALAGHDRRTAEKLLQETRPLLQSAEVPIEFRCAEAALDSSLAVFAADQRPVVHVAGDDAGDRIITANVDGLARIWDVHTGSIIRKWNPETTLPRSVALRDEGSVLEGVVAENVLRVTDLATKRLAAELPLDDLSPSGESVTSVVASPDGGLLAAGGRERNGSGCIVRVWDARTGERRATFRWSVGADALGFCNVTFHPRGDLLLAVVGDRNGYLWRVSTGEAAGRIVGHTARIQCASFTGDGRLLVTGGDDQVVRVWNPETLLQVGSLMGHAAAIRSVAIDGAGHVIAGAEDGSTRLWRINNAKGCILFDLPARGTFLAFSADGSMLAVGDSIGGISLFDTATWTLLRGMRSPVDDACMKVAFTPDGSRLVSCHGSGRVHVWNTDEGTLLTTLETQHGHGRSLAISPDGATLAVGYAVGQAAVFDVQTGATIASVAAVQTIQGCPCVAFGLGGARLATGARELFDPRTGSATARLENEGVVASLAASPDGTILVTGSDDGKARSWDFATGLRLAEMVGHRFGVRIVAFSPDGQRVATGSFDNTVRIWDPRTGEVVHVLEGHTGWVQSLAFSGDGRRLVSGGWDNKIRIWDTESGEQLSMLEGHSDYVKHLAFSSDGRVLASCSFDGTLRLWAARPEDRRSRKLPE